MKAITQIKEELKNHVYDAVMERLYVAPEMIAIQGPRYEKVLNDFEALYGAQVVEIYSAPGRTEVGGNHTDHQLGEVLAASVNLDTIAVVAPRQDMKVRLKSEGYPALELDLSDLNVQENEKETTMALIRGMAAGFAKRGLKVGGFDASVTSQVLSGSGLSSSAAFEVLIGNILSGLYNNEAVSQIEIAKMGQEAENVFFGKPCGLMDQMASAVGGLVNIDFGDPRNPVVNPLDVAFSNFGHALCIVDTKGSHADLTQDYADVPAEMKKVACFFGQDVLKHVDEESFMNKFAEVRLACGDRAVLRAMHWYNENRRVRAQVAALTAGDFDEFKKQIAASGNSSYKYLQNVYSSHKPQEQSVSVALMISEQLLGESGVARVHGGGFAGTIQAFVPVEMTASYKEGMEKVFGEGACHVLRIRPVGGTKVL